MRSLERFEKIGKGSDRAIPPSRLKRGEPGSANAILIRYTAANPTSTCASNIEIIARSGN